MQIDLTGKVVIVTGGRQGLGNCLVSNFLQEGCQVVTCSRDGTALQQVIDGWEATYQGKSPAGALMSAPRRGYSNWWIWR